MSFSLSLSGLLLQIPGELVSVINVYLKAANGVFSSSWSGYNKSNIVILPPVEVPHKDLTFQSFVGQIMYQHSFGQLPMLLEFPELLCIPFQETETSEYRRVLRQDVGITCECSPTDPEYLKFREILMDVYLACLVWMSDWGQSQSLESKRILPKHYQCRMVEKIRSCAYFPDHLSFPVDFQEKGVYKYGRTFTEKDLDSPQHLMLSTEGIVSGAVNQLVSGIVSPKLIVCLASFISMDAKELHVR